MLNWNPGSQERLDFTKLFALRRKVLPPRSRARIAKAAKAAKSTKGLVWGHPTGVGAPKTNAPRCSGRETNLLAPKESLARFLPP